MCVRRKASKKRSYVNDIERRPGSGRQRVLVAPGIGLLGLAEIALIVLGDVEHVRDIVLHQGREARAREGRVGQTRLKLRREVDRVAVPIDLVGENLEEPLCGDVHSISLAEGDTVGHEPRKLLESADEALVGTLRAVLGVGRLHRQLLA